jgi:hypothetical protein
VGEVVAVLVPLVVAVLVAVVLGVLVAVLVGDEVPVVLGEEVAVLVGDDVAVVVGDDVAEVVGVEVIVVVGLLVAVVVGVEVIVVVPVVVTVVIWHCENTPSSKARMAPFKNRTSDWQETVSMNPSRVQATDPTATVGKANSLITLLSTVSAAGLHRFECNAGVPVGVPSNVSQVTVGTWPLPS